jgi:glyoxylase-like metal-dependent hydrolase (beta-lactamase superfamily II)
MLPEYEIYAIRYATRNARRADHFIGGDPHDAPMPMDYFTWLVRNEERAVVVDTGFTEEIGAKRGRIFLRCPVETLSLLDVAPESVGDVVLTHLHYDHVGNFHKFPAARFHLQEKEMHYATGRYMRYAKFGHSFEVEDVVGMVRLNFKGRVEMHRGDVELAPGLSLHFTGGHTAGLQVVRVMTKRGWVVLASDASHYYEHRETNRLYTTAFHLGEMIDAYRTVERLAASDRHIIPGHDPLVMRRYRPPRPELEGIVVRLDENPRE